MRTCGPCTACCTVMAVDEIGKPAGTRCDKCATAPEGRGCSIYDSRPQSCRDFECVWLRMPEHLRNMERPDQVGVMLDLNLPDNKVGEQVLVARETRPGAFDEDAAKVMLQRLGKRVVVLLVGSDGKRGMIGPKGDIRRIKSKLKVLQEHK